MHSHSAEWATLLLVVSLSHAREAHCQLCLPLHQVHVLLPRLPQVRVPILALVPLAVAVAARTHCLQATLYKVVRSLSPVLPAHGQRYPFVVRMHAAHQLQLARARVHARVRSLQVHHARLTQLAGWTVTSGSLTITCNSGSWSGGAHTDSCVVLRADRSFRHWYWLVWWYYC